MKQMTLDQTWTECLEMWRWIAKTVKAADAKRKRWNVNYLKDEWTRKQGYGPFEIREDCFFCDWNLRYGKSGCGQSGCGQCPGSLVEKGWKCHDPKHNYKKNPIAFLAKLNRLDRIRRKGKK